MKQKGLPIFKKKKELVYPNQYICEEKANGLMCNGNFYPFEYTEWGAMPVLDPNKLIYIKTIIASCMEIGPTIAIERPKITASRPGWVPIYLWLTNIPVLPAGQVFNTTYMLEPKVLLPLDVIQIVKDEPGTSEIFSSIIYAYIDLLPGQMKPKVIEE